MKHVNEFYTCDRCGKKIKEVPENTFRRIVFPGVIHRVIDTRIKTFSTEPMVMNQESEIQKINEHLLVESLKLTYCYNSKEGDYHLCPDCRKAFELYMTNEL